VPHGRTASGKPPRICDAGNLRVCSAALQGVTLEHGSFVDVLSDDDHQPRAGDLVYLDPPYVPEPGKDSFTAYTAGGFCGTDHLDVAIMFRELASRGAYVVASNSATPRVRELYRGFRQIELQRTDSVNCKTEGGQRRKVKELLILGWERT